jgi:hypothetical protein
MFSARALLVAAILSANFGTANAATVVGGSDLLVGSNLAQVESWLVNDPRAFRRSTSTPPPTEKARRSS